MVRGLKEKSLGDNDGPKETHLREDAVLGLLVGGFLACFVILFVTAALSSGNIFMDHKPGEGSSIWPFLVVLPLGIGLGFFCGAKIAKQPPDKS